MKTPKRKKVALDLDNTLNKFTEYFFEYSFHKFGIDKTCPLSEMNNYDVTEFLATSRKKADEILEQALNDINFWERISPAYYSKELVNYLVCSDFYEPIISTYPWKFQYNSIAGKLSWIRFTFKEYEKIGIQFSDRKWNYEYDIAFDDSPKYLIKFRDHGTKTIKMIQPYNYGISCDYEINDCKEAMEIFKKIEEQGHV